LNRALQAAEKLEISGEISEKHPSVAKASIDSVGFMRGLKPPPPSALSFSAACKARILFGAFAARLKSCPFKTSTYSAIP
jgi:hypothetical protein